MNSTWSNLKQITNQNERKRLFSSDSKQLQNMWKLGEGIPGIFWNQWAQILLLILYFQALVLTYLSIVLLVAALKYFIIIQREGIFT